MEKTAMQLHIEDLEKVRKLLNESGEQRLAETVTGCISIAEHHLPKERQQIEDAYKQGYREGESDGLAEETNKKDISEYSDASQYYTTTYGE